MCIRDRANTVPNALTSLLQFVGALVIMIAMDWKMTAIIFITVPIVFVAVMPVMKIAGRIGWKRQDELANFAGDSTNILSEIRLVKSSNSEKKELVTGKQRINNLYNIGVKEAKINSLTTPLTNMMMMVLFIGVLSYGAVRVMNHSLSMGDTNFLLNVSFPNDGSRYCLLYTSPSPRDGLLSRMPSSA